MVLFTGSFCFLCAVYNYTSSVSCGILCWQFRVFCRAVCIAPGCKGWQFTLCWGTGACWCGCQLHGRYQWLHTTPPRHSIQPCKHFGLHHHSSKIQTRITTMYTLASASDSLPSWLMPQFSFSTPRSSPFYSRSVYTPSNSTKTFASPVLANIGRSV